MVVVWGLLPRIHTDARSWWTLQVSLYFSHNIYIEHSRSFGRF